MGLAFAGGYVRDALIASQLGARSVADGYFFGIQISLSFQGIFLLGALAPAIVPPLAAAWNNPEEFASLGRAIYQWVVIGTAVGSIVLIATAGPIVQLLGSALNPEAQRTAVVVLQTSAIMLPFVAAGVTASSLVNVQGRFVLPAFAWAASNIGTAALVIPLFHLAGPAGVGWAWTLGNGLYAILLVPPIHRAFRGTRWTGFPATGSHVFIALLTISGFFATAQVSAIAERIIAAHLTSGSIAQISYAEKLAVIPSSLLAGAVSTVIFPRLAYLADNRQAGNRLLETSIRTTLFLVVPVSAWVIVFAPIASAAGFQRGALSAADASAIGRILAIYALGMTLVAVSTIMFRALFAGGLPQSALIIGSVNTAFYVVLAVLLSSHGTIGLAWAWTIAQITTVAMAAVALRWPDWESLRRLPAFLMWVMVASAIGVLAARGVTSQFGTPAGVARLPSTALLALLSAGLSFMVLVVTPLPESRRIRRQLGWRA